MSHVQNVEVNSAGLVLSYVSLSQTPAQDTAICQVNALVPERSMICFQKMMGEGFFKVATGAFELVFW
jgi:hypothetical protein